ncbi:MAG: TetR/AcrR family transcriptional regulator [Proteobacteria bacterium]|jgi:AcrR family transcriptional regulator|nr:TetR/AcrR family transcriptional regulator [Pseudomonadota bacterium]
MAEKKLSKIKSKGPLQRRSKETFEVILTAATRILGKEGPDGFNTNSIAQVAGVSIGSLYQYFKNKDSIMLELFLRVLDASVEKSLSILDVEDDPRKVIETLVDESLDSLMRQGKATLYVLERAPTLMSDRRFKKAEERIIPKIIQKTKERGINLRPQNVEVALLLSIQVVRAAGWTVVREKSSDLKQELKRELSDLLCRYLLSDSTDRV